MVAESANVKMLIRTTGASEEQAQRYMSVALAHPLALDLVLRYEIDLATTHTHDTVAAYTRSLLIWLQYCTDHTVDPLVAGRSDALAYREQLQGQYAISTVRIRLSAMRSFFDWYSDRCGELINPFVRVQATERGQTVLNSRRSVLTGPEVTLLLKRTLSGGQKKDLRDHAMLSLMAYCALRVVELSRAEFGDLDIKSGRRILWVWGKGRSRPDEFVILPVYAVSALQAWCDVHPRGGGSIFCALDAVHNGRPQTVRSLRRVVKLRYRAAGIVGQTAHALRRTAIKNAIQHGANLLNVNKMSRHADIRTTLQYIHGADRITDPAEDYVDYGN